jgi:hypothetical protein
MHLRTGNKELISNDMSFKTKDKISATIYMVYIMLITSILLMILSFMYFKFSITNGITFDNDDTYITLNGPWKFKIGDNQQWAVPNFNDSEWEIVDFTAPPGARDGDVGISGYVPGWTGKGHPNYSGYAWYRMKVSIENTTCNMCLAKAGRQLLIEMLCFYFTFVLTDRLIFLNARHHQAPNRCDA